MRWPGARTSRSVRAGCGRNCRLSASRCTGSFLEEYLICCCELFWGCNSRTRSAASRPSRRRAAQTILPLQRIERWGFDPEILFLARKFGFRVEEVPVLWGHSGGTRIHPLIDGARMFQEMLRIRWYDLTGKYDGAAVSARPVKRFREDPRQESDSG